MLWLNIMDTIYITVLLGWLYYQITKAAPNGIQPFFYLWSEGETRTPISICYYWEFLPFDNLMIKDTDTEAIIVASNFQSLYTSPAPSSIHFNPQNPNSLFPQRVALKGDNFGNVLA